MGIEDKISVEDLTKKDTKELLIMVYLQTAKTNGIVKEHEDDIECLKKEIKTKIDWKIFTILASVLTVVIATMNLLNLFLK